MTFATIFGTVKGLDNFYIEEGGFITNEAGNFLDMNGDEILPNVEKSDEIINILYRYHKLIPLSFFFLYRCSMKLDLYDFDGTIYDGDSGVDLILFSIINKFLKNIFLEYLSNKNKEYNSSKVAPVTKVLSEAEFINKCLYPFKKK